ncbi:hypothetical protein IPH92_04225 [Candidatus Kaiserbacteria bacterium]|nr:MAG: hypothetical protein IPH92_04225 [Candidatus Kaiserbacteria bacterium]
MLYVFFGTDTEAVRTRARETVASLGDTVGDRTLRISPDTYVPGMLADIAGSVSLFGDPQVVVLDMFSENQDALTDVCALFPILAASLHTFVLIEGVLPVAIQKECKAHANVFEEIKKEAEKLDVFALCDALIARDKKRLWLLFISLTREGVRVEEIIGILLWQLKLLRLAERTGSSEEAGQKSYPYQKAKRALSAFKKGEVDTFSRALLIIYHEGHAGKRDTTLALEAWILGI